MFIYSSSENDASSLAPAESTSCEDISVSSLPLNPLFEDKRDVFVPLSLDEQSYYNELQQPSSPGSLGVDFGTDSSLLFQNFTADVLKATEEKLKYVDLKLPKIQKESPKDNSRVVTVNRSPAGDFGIALRRSTLNKKENSRIIHLVEPTSEKHVTGLLPGDCLVEVDGINVENFSREEIIDKVSNAGKPTRSGNLNWRQKLPFVDMIKHVLLLSIRRSRIVSAKNFSSILLWPSCF